LNSQTQFICASGKNTDRTVMINKLESLIKNPKYASIIHPSVVIFPDVKIASGVFVAANTTLATGCSIGKHSVVNQNVSVGHDCELESNVVVSPGCVLSGRTRIESDVFLGSNVVTYPGISIGEKSVISAMTSVPRSVKSFKKIISKPNQMVFDI